MRGRWTVVWAALGFVVLLIAGGCSSSDDGGGESYASCMADFQQEMSSVDMNEEPWNWDMDFEDHLACFEAVLDDDPNNADALLMASFCRMMVTATDPEMADIWGDLFEEESRSTQANVLFWYLNQPTPADMRAAAQRLMRDDFVFSDIQSFIEDEVLPSLEEIDAHLTLFEELDAVVTLDPWAALPDSIAPPDTVMPELLEFDATDAYFAHVPVDFVQCLCYLAVSYNVDANEGQTLEDLIDEDADFLTLRQQSHMMSAYDEMLEAATHLRDACDELEAETDDQTHDFITKTVWGWVAIEDEDVLGPGAVDTLRNAADAIDDALTDGVIINPSDTDPEAPDIDILLDLEAMFYDPLDDLRDYFPYHTWNAEGDSMIVTEPLTFPDPTFDGDDPGYDGIFPEMTNEDWRLIYDWEDRHWRGRAARFWR